MFKHKDTRALLLEEQQKNQALNAKLMTYSANLDYIAMMCDIELDEPDGEEVPTDGAKPEL